MSATLHRRLWVLLVSAAVAAGVWRMVPGTPLDRAAFTTVAASYVNPPLFVSGNGTHVAPWELRAFTARPRPDARQAPVIVSLGDDVEGFFQSSPPAPIDIAVVLRNFQRLRATKAATAAVLAWESPDPIGLAALEKSLERFDSLVMAAPLSRGAVGAPMPPAFRSASVPVSAVKGDASALPVVNRIPLPGVILGGESTAAGFSVLESEAPSRALPLMAVWEDRVVFAFPLLTVMQRLGVPPADLEIHPGKFLKIGASGPVVPIDRYGRLAVPLRPVASFAEISAEALIDGGDDLFPKQAPDPVILRDDRSAAEPATRAFSRGLAAAITTLASEDGLARAHVYPRLPRDWEIGILSAAVVLLVLLCGAGGFSGTIGALVVAGIFTAAQWAGVGIGSVWLPGLPVLAAVAAAFIVSKVVRGKSSPPTAPAPVVGPVPRAETPADPPPAAPQPPQPAAKTTPPKKAPAKKAAKKSVRGKKPPPKS